jgi:hypothetical protein
LQVQARIDIHFHTANGTTKVGNIEIKKGTGQNNWTREEKNKGRNTSRVSEITSIAK